MNFRVIEGGKQKAHFVCPWYAATFEKRADLASHWLQSPVCSKDRSVNNPAQAKYDRNSDSSDDND